MGLADTIQSLFSSNVRQRGASYAASGAVRFVDYGDGWAELNVDGSAGEPYAVTLDWSTTDGIELDCTCPHFTDGNYCKHLWAAALVIDKLSISDEDDEHYDDDDYNDDVIPIDLWEGSAGLSTRSKDRTWQEQLERHRHQTCRKSQLLRAGQLGRAKQVHYLLELSTAGAAPMVSLFARLRREDDQWDEIMPLRVHHLDTTDIDDAKDRAVLALLLGNRVLPMPYDDSGYLSNYSSSAPTRVELSPQLCETILPRLCATGRFVWLLDRGQGFEDARPIDWDDGPAWKYRLRVELVDRRRSWRLTGELMRGRSVRPLRDAVHCFAAGWLLMDDTLARLDVPRDFTWLETLRAGDELVVPVKDREKLLNELWRSGESPELIGDESLCLQSIVGSPIGQLVVHQPVSTPRYPQQCRRLYASLAYLYDGRAVSPNGTTDCWLAEDGTQMTARNAEAEDKLLDRLLHLKLEPKAASNYGKTPPGHFQFSAGELNRVVESLVAEGWLVEAEGTRIRKGGGMSVSVRSDIDWFDLEVEVDFDGLRATLPDLLEALRQNHRYVQLDDGNQGLLPQEWLDRYAPLADLATKQDGNVLRFQPGQALLLDSLLSVRERDVRLKVDQRFAALRRRLASFSGVKPANAPRSFQGELREYQREGLGWLRFLEKFGFGGCLADDMGLGKTVQVLALLADRRRRQPRNAKRRPTLIVAPKSVVHNWRLEAERFAPRLAVADYSGTDRRHRIPDFAEHDLIVTTYGTLRQDIEQLAETSWDYAILDEAQAIKNSNSQAAKASRLLNARHRLALSGTPIENHLGELWSIFEFLNPGMLGRSKALRALTRNQTEEDDARLEALRKGLAPFLIRRTKQQVLPELPQKTEQCLYCDLPAAQRKQYNQLRDHYRAALTQRIAASGLAKSKIHVLEALLRLRQAACHPGLIDVKQKTKTSAKLELLIEQVAEVVDEGHKALVFSQFTSMLDIVKARLDKVGVCYEYLDGQTRKRHERIDRFQSDETCPVFLISLKAGGAGLNLTAADFVYLLDPWWNPAVEAQAIDRAHRIGQSRPVFAYRLIARDTVEEKILELQAQKSDLAEAIISGDSSLLRQLSAEDLNSLLS